MRSKEERHKAVYDTMKQLCENKIALQDALAECLDVIGEEVYREALTPVESSNIGAITYLGKSLYIQFKGGAVYRYFDVSQDVYTEMMKAESVGKAFHARVKNAEYKFEKLELIQENQEEESVNEEESRRDS